jgi:hypothetical protein
VSRAGNFDSAPWTSSEDAILAASYARGGIKDARAALPSRSEASIYNRAKRLGVKRRRRWTSADDANLRDLWEQGLRLSAISKHLNRTKATCYVRAQKLGFRLGCPVGFEHLTAAAERTGFSPSALRRILRWAGKPVRATVSRPVAASWRRQIVDPLDVDEAVAAWLETEPVEAAARRLGIDGQALRARLERIGVANKPGTKAHLRITEEQLEAANRIAKWDRRHRSQAPLAATGTENA